MRIFYCDHCGQFVYFENVFCTNCGYALGFSPHLGKMCSWESADGRTWISPYEGSRGQPYRRCQNYEVENVCNWMIPEEDQSSAFCLSCRLNRMIPDLGIAKNKEYWFALEKAKRRLVYSLLKLRLPVLNREQDPEWGLAFEFKAVDDGGGEPEPVLTGHHQGVITVNLYEADDAVREKIRVDMREPYRTLLGHLRHEAGHYYWFRLIEHGGLLESFREHFGDDTQPYSDALERYYNEGPSADWPHRFVSAYASSHPWEDWAETWAHYLHIMDTYETAHSWGIRIQPPGAEMISLQPEGRTAWEDLSFNEILDRWDWVSRAVNTLNRSMGLRDVYPFVLSNAAIAKLHYIHDLIRRCRAAAS